MINYKCSNCGGQMELSAAGGFSCPFCGSRSYLSDSDLKGSEEFRKKMVAFFKGQADAKETDYSQDTLFSIRGTDVFLLKDGKELSLQYMTKSSGNGYTCYVLKESVAFIFPDAAKASAYLEKLAMLDFPEADSRNLAKSFPQLKMKLDLKMGTALVFTRFPFFYPASLFAQVRPEHLAWMISRMENLCCVLQYSDMGFGDLSADSFFVNPKTHEGSLYGDWSMARPGDCSRDLQAIRDTGKVLWDQGGPRELADFLNSRPKTTAYDDFSMWDEVIEKGFGGHNFVQMRV